MDLPKKLMKKKKGISLESKSSQPTVRPIVHKFNRAGIEAFDAALSDYDVIDGTRLPPLERCGITVEGVSKSGKSAMSCGNDRLVIIKLPDGQPILPRCRAKVVLCRSLSECEKITSDLMKTASKLKKDSPYCQICYDPISVLCTWHAQRAVELRNRDKCCDDEGNLIPAMKKKLIDVPGDMEGYGPWNSIADRIERMFMDWSSLGWGWIAPIHYQWKAASNFDGEMDWRPNIPPTTADRLAKIADGQITTERIGNQFTVKYVSDTVKKVLGAKVPLLGMTELPDYLDEDTPAGITSWDYISADFEEACKEFTADQTRFRVAYKAILDKLKEGQ